MNSASEKPLGRNSGDTEERLWRQLRDRRLHGFRFRRQFPLGIYMGDFVCVEARLVVEVDGGQHDARRDYDERRTAWLNSQGFKLLRFRDDEMTSGLDAVLEIIRNELLATPGAPSAERFGASAPAPAAGGEAQNGFALATALVFLLVITLLGVSLFLGVNLQQKAAGNTLEKIRALELANSATMAAERWLADLPDQTLPNLATCTANSADFRVCVSPPAAAAQPGTWMSAGATPIGFADLDVSPNGGTDTYYKEPGVWISYLGQATMGPGDLYRIDAYAWGGNAKSLVVTETVFYVGGATKRATAARSLGH